MTHEVVTLDPDTPAGQSLKQLRDLGIQHIAYPVVNKDGILQGILDDNELITAMPDLDTGALVVGQSLTVAYPDASIREIANRMVAKDLHQLAIVSATETGKLLGIVTLNDIARQRFAEETCPWLPYLAVARLLTTPCLLCAVILKKLCL